MMGLCAMGEYAADAMLRGMATQKSLLEANA